MSDSSADRDPLERLAEEFVARFRRGERPSLTEYAGRLPGRADEVRELFPALVEMEQLKPVSADRTGAFVPEAEPSDPARVGEFRILRRVGLGGMGVVYEAVQESLGRHVALKLLPPEALLDPRRLERFRREARAAARLHHTNIVPVFGVGEADGRHFYAMQFIAGHPLDAVIDEVRRLKEKSAALPAAPRAVSEIAGSLLTGTFQASRERERPEEETPVAHAPGSPGSGSQSDSSPAFSGSISEGGRHYFDTVARVGAQVADALAYAHAQGILHRDIKPANLLLDLRGTVWVTDFGLAKATDADDLTHAGDVVGTLRYMAPERFDGPGDARADVYALGLTLYELLTLRPAFAAENRAKLVQQVTAAAPPSPRSVNPAIPRDLETVVLKAIARDPAMRYQTASELAEDLRRFVEDRPIRARRASSAEQAWRWCRRNRAVASLLAAVLIVLAMGAGVSAFFAMRAGDRAREANEERARAGKREQEAAQREKEANDARKDADARAADLKAERDITTRLLYVSHINHAQTALNDGRTPRVLELLRETTPRPGEPDLRNWEWHYLNRLVSPDREFPLTAPGLQSPGVILSHDGERVLLSYFTDEGQYFEVKETLTGRLVGRVPKTGVIPLARNKDPQDGLPRQVEVAQSVFSQDGRHVLVIVSRNLQRQTSWSSVSVVLSVDMARSQLWDVETGTPSSIPAELANAVGPGNPTRPLVLGPGAAWAVWTRQPAKAGPGTRTGPVEVTCYRWERASGTVTPSKPFRIGQGSGHPLLTPDGGTVYWLAEAAAQVSTAPGSAPSPPPADFRQPWFECWDVTTPDPKPRFKPFRLPERTAGMTGSGRPSYDGDGSGYMGSIFVAAEVEFSTAGTMAAYRTAAGEIVVYRLPTGKDAPGEAEVHARFPLTGALPSVFQALFGRSFFVADDGNRLVFRGENQMAVLEKAWSGVTVRKIPYVDTDSSQYAFGTPPAKLLGDGKTFVQIDQFLADRGRAPQVRVWDVSRDPNRFVPENVPSTGSVTVRRDGQWVRTLAVPGGHVSLEWPGREPKDGEPDPTNFRGRDDIPDVFTGPFVVRDAGDKVLGKVTDVPGSYRLTAQTLAEGRRLFVHYRFPTGGLVVGGKRQSVELAYQWRLYDLDNRAREIDGGSGTWMRPEGAPYFLEVPGQADGTRLLRTHLILRDGRTGDPIGRVQLPNRSVSFCDFDPTGRTFLVQSVAVAPDVPPAPRRVLSTAELAVTGAALGGNPRPGPLLPVGPEGSRFEYLGVQPQIRLHLFDVATHKELHAWDIAPENFLFVASTARFSPDGRRILFRYVTGTPGAPGPARVIPDKGWLWVARPDGMVEHNLQVHEFPKGGGPRVGFSPGARLDSGMVCSPDGRHVAISADGEVQVWDLDAGKLKHRLAGHLGGRNSTGIGAIYNADGSRLFTYPFARALGSVGPEPVHVWDTATGRELLTINVQPDDRQFGSMKVELVGEKLYLRTPNGGVRVLDGTPVKP